MMRYPAGGDSSELRAELARYLTRTRGVSCLPEQIAVFPGTEAALGALLDIIPRRAGTFGVEEPGYDLAWGVARARGLDVVGLPSNQGAEHFFGALASADVDAVFTTPSHQFPTGRLMSLSMRTELLKQAERRGFYIIEDDSCNEYRYGTAAVPSLQSLDAGNRVIYLGNFSKVLTPALRVAFAVLPPDLLRRHHESGGASIPKVNTHVQDALAVFIADGHLDRHVRRMVASNKVRHDELLRCLNRELGSFARLSGIDSGMHILADLDTNLGQRELVERAFAKDVGVYPTTRFWFSRPAPPNELIIGFSAIALEDIAPGTFALRKAWCC